MNNTDFSSLSLKEALIKNLASLGYVKMTPVQAQSLPIILQGKNAIVQAKTGSGKTIAFALTLLNCLRVENITTQSLILCPTRELAEQVSQIIRQLAKKIPNVRVLNLSGGIPMRPQLESLRHGVHVIVGTPGRVKKHVENDSLRLDQLQTLVLDEADRMLDMGFCDDITDIFTYCPLDCQIMMFSATYPPGVKKLASKSMLDPQKITIEEKECDENIEQVFYKTKSDADKFSLLKALLLHHKPHSVLIFCNLKEQTLQLVDRLQAKGFSAVAMNGDMEQVERDNAIIRFKNQTCSILVATDVAARGLDINELPLVINVELANNHDIHVHRIGRTGRAGKKGLAISFVTAEDMPRVAVIQEKLGKSLSWGEISQLNTSDGLVFRSDMITLYLSAGRKDKVCPGDILGVLTKEAGLLSQDIGKIDIGPIYAHVAVRKNQVDKVLKFFVNGRLKGRKVVVRRLN